MVVVDSVASQVPIGLLRRLPDQVGCGGSGHGDIEGLGGSGTARGSRPEADSMETAGDTSQKRERASMTPVVPPMMAQLCKCPLTHYCHAQEVPAPI